MGVIDPVVVNFTERLILSNTLTLFTSGDSKACKSLVKLIEEITGNGDLITIIDISSDEILTDYQQKMRFTG